MAKLKRIPPPVLYSLALDNDERCLLLSALRYKLSKVALNQKGMDAINALITELTTEA